MADSHSIPDVPIAETERSIIVGYRPHGLDKSTPKLQLSGKWLREAGFDTGAHITVKVMNGCIVLVPFSNKEETLAAELNEVRQALSAVKSAVLTTSSPSV